jgi:hypothetical protein
MELINQMNIKADYCKTKGMSVMTVTVNGDGQSNVIFSVAVERSGHPNGGK